MKNFMKMMIVVMIVTGSSTLTGCGHARTKWTDPVHRVLIDPTGIPAAHHARIQQALHQNGKFIVVDRAAGYDALIAEQNREHMTQGDRFMDREKYALYGKIYGVGGIVTAHVQCQRKSTWIFRSSYNHCRQYLAIIDARTSEVMATAEATEDGDSGNYNEAPSWESAVDKLADNFPAKFEKDRDDEKLVNYKDVSAEEAQRTKEHLDRKTASELK